MRPLLELGAGFHPDLTGRENVYMNATILGMSHKQIDAVFDEIVEQARDKGFTETGVRPAASAAIALASRLPMPSLLAVSSMFPFFTTRACAPR